MPAYPLGMDCVSAAARAAGHEVTALDLYCAADLDAAVRDAVRGASPDAIGISVRNIDDQSVTTQRFMLDTARAATAACRAAADAPVVLGGAGYSIYPQAALDYCGADWGVHGEGEEAFPALLAAIERSADPAAVPGVFARNGAGCRTPRRLVSDLDVLPLPDYSLWAHMPDKGDLMLPVQTRRGCALDCSYCSTAAIEGRSVRRRSIPAALRMLERAASAGFRNIFFTDNTFNLPPRYAKDLCQGILDAALDIRWQCIYYPWKHDPELARLMRASGCRFASLGAESGSPEVLRELGKRFGTEHIREAAQLLKDNGIKVMGFLMLGGPGETRETALESFEFMDTLGLDMVKLTLGIRIYPGTRVAARAVSDGLARPDDDLLRPRYYIVPGLEDWLRDAIREWASARPGWMSDFSAPAK